MSLNHLRFRPLSWVKRGMVRGGIRPYAIPCGLYRGLRLMLDLQHQTQFYCGLHERETYRWIRRAARSCRWMVDVGAGRGELCLYFLGHSPAQRVIAVEPQASEVALLRENVRLNPALPDRLEVLAKFMDASPAPDHVALDALGLPAGERGFLKIDVDGQEVDVLHSGERLLSEGNGDILIETHSQQLERDCLDWLQSRGYTCRIIPNAWWRAVVPERRPLPHNRWLSATRAY